MKIEPISLTNYNQIAAIYKEGIDSGMATFETNVPIWNVWDAAHLSHSRIALYSDTAIIGWGALSAVSSRKVYRGVAEVSVYVALKYRGLGFGKKILLALIKSSEENGIWTLQSGIMSINKASIKMHLDCGFRVIGYREKIGKLNNSWMDNTILERRSKIIGI